MNTKSLLDKIDKKCSRQAGVRLSRNVKHNLKTFNEMAIVVLGFIALTTLMSMVGSFTMNNIYGIIGSAISSGLCWMAVIY